MKNLLRISLVFVLLLLVATTVKAATPEEFLKYITTPQAINGESVVLVTPAQKVQIERYLKVNDLSGDTLDYIEEQFDKAVDVMQEAKVTDYIKLDTVYKNKIIAIADETSAVTGIGYEPKANGSVVIENLDGTPFTIPSATVKQTGSSNYAYIIPVIAIVAVAIVIVTKRGLANAR